MKHLLLALVSSVMLQFPATSMAQSRPDVFLTGQELLHYCQGKDMCLCRTYLQGVWDALVDVHVIGQPRFCTRRGILAENLAIVFTSWAKRNASHLDHAAANLAAIAFSEAFTCAAGETPK